MKRAIVLCLLILACPFFFYQEALGASRPERKASAWTSYQKRTPSTASYYKASNKETKRRHRVRRNAKRFRAQRKYVPTRQIARNDMAPARHYPHANVYGREKGRTLGLVLDSSRFVRSGPKGTANTLRGRQSRIGVPTRRPSQDEHPKVFASVSPTPITDMRRLPLINVSNDGRISANIEGRTLGDVLRPILEKNLIEVKGALPLAAMVTARFSNLSPEQALHEIMQGYNYALIRETGTDKLIVMVVSQSKKDAHKQSEIVMTTFEEKSADAATSTAHNGTELAKLQQLCGQINATDRAEMSKRPEVLIALSDERKVRRTTEGQRSPGADENLEVAAETIPTGYAPDDVPRVASTTR